jgi:hypothetical protein
MHSSIFPYLFSICILLLGCKNQESHLSIPAPIQEAIANESIIAPPPSTIQGWIKKIIDDAQIDSSNLLSI